LAAETRMNTGFQGGIGILLIHADENA
jgi:hypothetical protein